MSDSISTRLEARQWVPFNGTLADNPDTYGNVDIFDIEGEEAATVYAEESEGKIIIHVLSKCADDELSVEVRSHG